MKKIKLYDNNFALVDDNDYDRISKHTWFSDGNGYAVTNTNPKGTSRLMHRMVLTEIGKLDVDHINGNILDNTRKNLRVCTRSENLHNSKKHKDNKSGYKGVYKHSQGKWCALIMVRGKREYLGLFDTAIEAAIVYDNRALQLHGDFARLNIKRK